MLILHNTALEVKKMLKRKVEEEKNDEIPTNCQSPN